MSNEDILINIDEENVRRACCHPTPNNEVAFGGMYNASTITVILSGTPRTLSLDSQLPTENVSFTPGALRINRSGVYLITYDLTITYSIDFTALALQLPYFLAGVIANGAVLPTSVDSLYEISCCGNKASKTTLVALPEGTTLNLAIWSRYESSPMDIVPGAQLIINRLGDMRQFPRNNDSVLMNYINASSEIPED